MDFLDEIEARLNKTTGVGWFSVIEMDSGTTFVKTATGETVCYLPVSALHPDNSGDRNFIAGARQDIPFLIREIRRLKSIIKKKSARQ